jgi:glycosyltransferase involved in cell wall biosynthesis
VWSLSPDPEPDVSVLVMAYNHGPYLRECLDGILGQQFDGSLEVLVGEDCSTDDTADVLAEYVAEHPEVRVVTAPTNVGMHENHRRLLRAAGGRYLAFCEGDDYWHDPGKLARQVALLEADTSISGCHSDFDHIEQRDGRWVRQRGFAARSAGVAGDRTTYEQLLERNLVQTCTLVLRRAVATTYLESLFGRRMFAVGDWPFVLFATATHGPLGFLPVSTATYRRVGGSATNAGYRSEMRRIEDQHPMLDLAVAELGGSTDAVRHGHELTDAAAMVVAARHGDRATAREHASRLARAEDPTLRRMASIVGLAARTPPTFSTARAGLLALRWTRSRVRYR